MRQLEMLGRLDTGRWELRTRGASDGDSDRVERVCMQGGMSLIQLRHPDQLCEKVVIEDSSRDITVQYTCRGHGYGRTHIRRESGRLIQIETQGIVAGLPFDFAAEGRRIGDC
ncbi:MAG: hypothetical protein ABJA20_04100 [Novosphingobium sp.]